MTDLESKEIKIEEIKDGSLFIHNPDNFVSIAVSFNPIVTGDGSYWHVRRYFLAHWLGMFFGPLMFAFAPRSWKGLNFGVTRNGKWSWIEIVRDKEKI